MATTAEVAAHSFSRSSSLSAGRSPDTASTIYPERAIRPLPRSRLKSKLSPEQASAITYPPDPPPISPTLSFSVQENGTPAQQPRLTNGAPHHWHEHHHHHHHHHHGPAVSHHAHCTCRADDESGEDDVEFDHPDYRYNAPRAYLEAHAATIAKPDTLQRRLASAKPAPPGSTASSADGYESFENTSNKKKRKIPLSTASSMHQSQLSAEMANMGISSHAEEDEDRVNGVAEQHLQQQYNPESAPAVSGSGTGISGAGRGRYGRQDGRNRRPLGSSTMNTVNGSRASQRGSDAQGGADPGIENTGGIISQAIKTAAEQGPLTPVGKGRENVSLPSSTIKTNINSTGSDPQFTFTCESDSANKMVDHQSQYGATTPTPTRTLPAAVNNTHGTQTSPPLHGQTPRSVARRSIPPANAAPPVGQSQQQPAPPPKPKPRRNPAKEYALQAAQRKKNQQYQNYHHRPKHDDMWICEFCEYEDIYGAPPYAMIRRYEIKDRQERKKAAEKRRLLEKAKMKGRKNKKGAGKGKSNHANNAAPPAAPAHSQAYDPNLPPPGDDEYYDDDDYAEDDYEPMGPDDQYPQDYYPPPIPAGPPAMPAAGGGPRLV